MYNDSKKNKQNQIKDGESFLPFALPLFDEEEINEVVDTLKSGWITTGPKVKQFEKDFAEYIGCKYAIACNSCTAALHLALESIGLNEKDEVITTPMTFAATAEVIRYFNAKPVFIDISPETLNIDIGKIEAYISSLTSTQTKLTKAIIPVHYAGHPCDMDSILQMAKKYGLRVIEDAAHAFTAEYKGNMIGTLGDITCFSFYATKNITTGEGGMIATDNQKWANRMHIMSLHGISQNAWERYTAKGSWYYEIIAPGYKYNMTDLAAAIGLTQIRKADNFKERRKKIAAQYNKALKDLPQITIPAVEHYVEHSWQLYVIKLNLEYLSIDRDRFIEEMQRRGIGVSVHFIPLHIHPYYRKKYGYKPEDFPVAYETFKKIISLPIYPKMTDEDVNRVIEGILDVIRKHKQ